MGRRTMDGSLRDLVMPRGGPVETVEARPVRIRPGTDIVWCREGDRANWSKGKIIRDDGDAYLVATANGEITMRGSAFVINVDDRFDLATLDDLADRWFGSGCGSYEETRS